MGIKVAQFNVFIINFELQLRTSLVISQQLTPGWAKVTFGGATPPLLSLNLPMACAIGFGYTPLTSNCGSFSANCSIILHTAKVFHLKRFAMYGMCVIVLQVAIYIVSWFEHKLIKFYIYIHIYCISS